MNNYEIKSTATARSLAESLLQDVEFYDEFFRATEEIYSTLVSNWEGDSEDLYDVIGSLRHEVHILCEGVRPCVYGLADAVIKFADAIDQTASQDVQSGSTPVNTPGDTTSEVGTTGGENNNSSSGGSESEKIGFWEYHGNDFANDWDYSGCDGVLDYVGATVSGLCGTVGSVVNFAVDGVSECLSWIFG